MRREHLRISRHEEVAPRRKHGGGGRTRPQAGRDKAKFAKDQIKRFEGLTQKHQDRRRRFSKYIDPALIFELRTNQKVSMEFLAPYLRAMGARPLAAPTDGKGSWIVFADATARQKFAERLRAYASQDRYKFLDAIETVLDIDPADKIGVRLRTLEENAGATVVLDVELWGLPDEARRKAIDAIDRMARDHGGRRYDMLERTTFTLLRVHGPRNLVAELVELPEVAGVDLPFAPPELVKLDVATRDLHFKGPPSADAPAILIIDSGIVSGHPALKDCVLGEKSFISGIDDPADDTGHGTEVAGIAAYGDISTALETASFEPTHWILSAKVLHDDGYGRATFDDTKLLENQIIDAVEWAVELAPELRIVNLSLGDSDETMYYGRRQFPLAAVVDELAREHKLVFCISTGNYDWGDGDKYAEYLADNSKRVKIINPASAALALTVGSCYRAVETTKGKIQKTLFDGVVLHDQPSPFTRSGPGVNGAVKPELLAFGGQGFGSDGAGTIEKDVFVLNWKYIEEGRLFTVASGTSLAAAYVSFLVARVATQHKQAGPNLLRALAVLSAQVPDYRPSPFDGLQMTGTAEEIRTILNTYGWGVPDVERSMYSANDRVVLVAESEIAVDGIHVYPLMIPPEFLDASGERTVRIAVAHSPLTNRNRAHYLGNTLEFALFHDITPEDVLNAWAERLDDEESPDDDEDETPEVLKGKQIDLKPGVTVLKKGATQKAEKTLKIKSKWQTSKPFVLALRSRSRWLDEEAPPERYALVVELEQRASVDLHERVQVVNRVNVRTVIEQDVRV